VAAKIKELRTALPEGFLTGLGRRIIALTGLFEFGSDSPEKLFGTVLGDPRGDDISFGVASWNFRTGTLAPLLLEFQRTDPRRFGELLAEGASEIDAVLAGDRDAGLAFARRIQENKFKIAEPWRSRFEALGPEPKFQDVQVRTLEPFFRRAVALADEYGLRSERGLALCFNVIFVQGGVRGKARDQINAAFTAFAQEHRREPGEVERMRILANAVTESWRMSRDFIRVIRARYLLIANGSGPGPRGAIDLNERGIGLADFRTGQPIPDGTTG